MNAPEDKAAIRARLRALRVGVPPEQRDIESRSAARRALELPRVAAARNVLAFIATPEELDPSPLLDALCERGAGVTLPRIAGPGCLTLHTRDGDIELEEGPFGLRQPTAECALADIELIDLVIVPGVAFDATGARLGFGGGYYDRLFAVIPRAYRLALAYDFQIVSSIPAEEHDEPVDVIVTPRLTLVSPHAL